METRMKTALIFLLVFSIISCAKENPLIGKWKIKPGFSGLCSELQFTADKMFCDSLVEDVKYEILEGIVIVSGISELSKMVGGGISYETEAHHTIKTSGIMGKKIEYSRWSY